MQCPHCQHFNRATATKCEICERKLPVQGQRELPRPGGLRLLGECLKCGHINPAVARRCRECHSALLLEEPHEREGEEKPAAAPQTLMWTHVVSLDRKMAHVLICPPLGPMKLQAEKRYVIGRGETTDITLPGELVSRNHAVVYCKDGEYYVEDLGSSNGTMHNGRKVEEPALLADGDTISIGGFHLNYQVRRGHKVSTKEVLDEIQGAPTVVMQSEDEEGAAGDDGAPGIEGSVEDVPVAKLLRFFHANQLTGVLAISGPRATGEVRFQTGEIVTVWSGPEAKRVRGAEALRPLAGCQKGRFSFRTSAPFEGKREIEQATGALLTEVAPIPGH